MLDEDVTLVKGPLVDCLVVSQALTEGPLHTGTMGVRGAELNLFENGDLIFEV